MGQSFLATEGTIIGTQDAFGNWSWSGLSTLSPAEFRIVENFRNRIQQKSTARPTHPEENYLPARFVAG